VSIREGFVPRFEPVSEKESEKDEREMAYLGFTEENCRIRMDTDPMMAVEIALFPEDWVRFADSLGELSGREGSELRTDFPSGWTIFWKIREGESRFFVAHPETDQWVATLALSKTHLEATQARMREALPGPLSGLERVSRMSNVEVKIALQTPGESPPVGSQ
jgi:hypothetical protein